MVSIGNQIYQSIAVSLSASQRQDVVPQYQTRNSASTKVSRIETGAAMSMHFMYPPISPQLSPDHYDQDSGSSRRGSPSQPSPGVRPRKASNLSVPDVRGNMSRRSSANGNAAIEETAAKLNGLRVG